jgi:hypothetical protein
LLIQSGFSIGGAKSNYDAKTGNPAHAPLRITNDNTWVGSQIVDIAIGYNGQPCLRLNHLRHASIFDDWVDINRVYLHGASSDAHKHRLESDAGPRPRRYVEDTIMSYLERARPDTIPFVTEAIHAVNHARQCVIDALINHNPNDHHHDRDASSNESIQSRVMLLPRVLAIIVASYAI